MNILVLLVALAAIFCGFWQIMAGDSVWAVYRGRMRSRGIVAVERTPQWDTRRQISGAVLVGAGVLMFFIALSAPSQTSATRPVAGESSDFRLNGTPMSPQQVEEARAMGLFAPDKHR